MSCGRWRIVRHACLPIMAWSRPDQTSPRRCGSPSRWKRSLASSSMPCFSARRTFFLTTRSGAWWRSSQATAPGPSRDRLGFLASLPFLPPRRGVGPWCRGAHTNARAEPSTRARLRLRLGVRARLSFLAHLFKAMTRQHHLELLPLLRPLVPEDGIVLDVGGHAGQFAKFFARLAPRGRIYTFEPGSYALALLRRSTRRFANIEIVEAALGDRAQAMPLKGPDQSVGKRRLRLELFRGGRGRTLGDGGTRRSDHRRRVCQGPPPGADRFHQSGHRRGHPVHARRTVRRVGAACERLRRGRPSQPVR